MLNYLTGDHATLLGITPFVSRVIPNVRYGTIVRMKERQTVGERLVAVRDARGWKQAEFARQLGIRPASMRALEVGKSKAPAAKTLQRAKSRGINPDYIMDGKEPMFLAEIEQTLDEQTLLATFREMNPEQQDAVMAIVRQMRRKNPPGTTDPFGFDPPGK